MTNDEVARRLQAYVRLWEEAGQCDTSALAYRLVEADNGSLDWLLDRLDDPESKVLVDRAPPIRRRSMRYE